MNQGSETFNVSTMNHALSWVEISRSALHFNVRQFRHVIGPKVLLYPVVKANAYGHGLPQVSREVLAAGADGLAVNSLDETLAIRSLGLECPVLVLGYVALNDVAELVQTGAEPVVYNQETIVKLNEEGKKQGRRVGVHLKVETGTNRQGVLPSRIGEFIELFKSLEHIELVGVSTHFANIEDTTEHSYAQHQIKTFERLREKIIAGGLPLIRCHAACTAASILFPVTYHDLVRVGIGTYGLWPSKETYLSALMKFHRTMNLQPVLTWKTKIAQIKTIRAGEYVGYGCTYRTTRKTTLAILPVGYFEGYDRHFSNTAYVLIGGKRAPVRGRVCMNLSMADVTDIPGVQPEDEVILLGRQGDEEITAEYLASLAGTINYEIVTRINPLLPRVLVK